MGCPFAVFVSNGNKFAKSSANQSNMLKKLCNTVDKPELGRTAGNKTWSTAILEEKEG